MAYLWIKAFHIIFMVTWFAGLFYLPRLFMYHADENNQPSHELFKLMERRLFIIMSIGAILTLVFGLWMLMLNSGLLSTGWFHTKVLFLLLLFGFHFWCYRLMLDFRHDRNQRSTRFYRMINELPVIPLIVIVVLAVGKFF